MAESIQVWSEVLNCASLTLLVEESPCDDNKHILENLIRFLESLGSPYLDVWISSYE